MKVFTLVIILFSVMFSNVFAKSNPTFKAQVDTIIGDPKYIISYTDYAYLPAFINLSNQKEKIFKPCMDIISDPMTSESEKDMSILLLNKISIEHYFSFVNTLFSMYRSGHLGQYRLETALFPEHGFRPIIINYYRVKDERRLLKTMIGCNCLPKSLSKTLIDVLSGKVHRQQVQFYRDCCHPYDGKPAATSRH